MKGFKENLKSCPIYEQCFWAFNDICRRASNESRCLPEFSMFTFDLDVLDDFFGYLVLSFIVSLNPFWS
jgi:hypothetical protein